MLSEEALRWRNDDLSEEGRMLLDTPGRGYRAVGPAEGIAPSRRTGGTCGLVQCASLSLLILSGVAMLVTRPKSWPALPGYSPHSSNATHRGKRYGKRRAFMSLGRMGTSSSFVNNFMLRSRRPKKFKAQKAKAATKSVVLVGSHFEPGNALLETVFRDLCGRPRLGLRCDRDGATHRHDLKGLSHTPTSTPTPTLPLPLTRRVTLPLALALALALTLPGMTSRGSRATRAASDWCGWSATPLRCCRRCEA